MVAVSVVVTAAGSARVPPPSQSASTDHSRVPPSGVTVAPTRAVSPAASAAGAVTMAALISTMGKEQLSVSTTVPAV